MYPADNGLLMEKAQKIGDDLKKYIRVVRKDLEF